jgi:hypothetical protein
MPALFGLIDLRAYVATQKKVWATQKNAYLVLTRESASHRERHQRHG